MKFGPFEFQPRRIPTLVAGVLFILFLLLGFWQLDRADQKRGLMEEYAQRSGGSPQPLHDALAIDKALEYLRIKAVGHFDNDHTLLLDNQIYKGRPGFEVLAPLRLTGADTAILVNRGWIPLERSRRNLPEVPGPEGEQQIVGIMVQPSRPGLLLGKPDRGQQRWPKLVQYVDTERIAEQLGYPLLPYVVRLEPGQPHSFQIESNWQPTTFGPQRHIGYAVQWFALALALTILYLWVNTRRCQPPQET